MAENVRKERAQSRERRRSLAAKPFEELDQAPADDSRPTPLAAAKGVAATAAAAAVAGALAGAAKALLERDSTRSDDDAQNDETMEPQVDSAESPEQPEQRVQEEEPSDDEPEAEPDEDERPAVSTTAEAEAEPGDDDAEAEHARGAEAQADEPSDDQEHESNGARGRSASDTMQIVEQAREHLKNLLGEDAESVSGIERENGNWSVTLEVVEMHRIPESTDILSSYSAVLDDDGGIVSLTRRRRYRRSQIEES